MSEKIVRFKYKSDIINCIEESWEYYGKEDEQRRVIKELNNVYKIASSSKNAPKPEYEAKAIAFDAILKSYDESYSNSHLGDEIIGIIQKYAESRSGSDD